MKLNKYLRPFTLTVSAAVATLLMAPALWPEVEKRFMNWAVPDDAPIQVRADSTARQARNPAATSLVHGAISGVLVAPSSALEELPHGAAWPQITTFDREFAGLVDTLRHALPFVASVPDGSGIMAFAKNGLSEETLQDPDFGANFLTLASPLVRRRGMSFGGSRSGGVDLSDEALPTYATQLLAALVTCAEGSATWTFSDSLVSLSVNTAPVSGGSVAGSGYSTAFSTAISTPPGVQPALVVVVNAPQSPGWSGFVAAPPPVSGSNARWNGRPAGGSLPVKLRPGLKITAHSPLATTLSSIADRGVVSVRSNLFTAPLSAPAPMPPSALASNVPTAFLAAPAGTNTASLKSTVIGSGTSMASGNGLTPISVNPVNAQGTSGLTINPTYDSTIMNDPNAATIEASIQTAINNIQNYIASPVTVNITFQEMGSGLASSVSYHSTVSYATYLSQLKNYQTRSSNDNIAIASLGSGTTNDPVTGNANIVVNVAPLQALGFTFGSVPSSTVGLNTSIMNLSRSGTQNSNFYDLQAAAAHEIDEVLGIGGPGSQLKQNGSTAGPVGPLDLYRYSSNGVRSYSVSSGADPYFSINGGAKNLVYFNQEGANDGADFSDWGNGITNAQYGNTPPQVQDAYGTPGSQPNLGINEMTALDVIGWNMTSAGLALEGIPEPDSGALLAGAAITLLVVHRRRKSAAA